MSANTIERLDRIVSRISQVGVLLASLALSVLLLGSVADSIARLVTGRAISGVLEASENLLVIAVFLALGGAYRAGAHVAVEGIVRLLPRDLGRVAVKLITAIMCVLLFWLTMETGRQAMESIAVREMRQGTVQMPVWPARLAVPVGFGVLLLEAMVGLFRKDVTPDNSVDVEQMI